MSEMTEQWTVSFEKDLLSAKALKIMEEQSDFQMWGTRVDLEEGEFFYLEAVLAEAGIDLPVDGSSSWCKYV